MNVFPYITRRAALAGLAGSLLAAARKLPANQNVKWALGTNLWNSFPRVPFTDILDVMKDTGFIGARITQFPQILNTYNITAAQMQAECVKRGVQIITISFSGPAHIAARRAELIDNAKKAMTFLKEFGAERLVVFSPGRGPMPPTPEEFKTMCEGFNEIGALANSMGFRAGLHNHLNQMVENDEEVDRCMAMTDPKKFWFSPDVAHLQLGGSDPAATIRKYKDRLIFLDYKDARFTKPTEDCVEDNGKVVPKDSPTAKLLSSIYDLGDGVVDFPGCHRVLKEIGYKGWICVDLDTARKGPRTSYERCGKYVVSKLEPVYR